MKYRNKRTGAVIDVSNKISGGEWEAVQPSHTPEQKEVKEKKPTAAPAKTVQKKKTVRKRG